jgi:hypothetical protein
MPFDLRAAVEIMLPLAWQGRTVGETWRGLEGPRGMR